MVNMGQEQILGLATALPATVSENRGMGGLSLAKKMAKYRSFSYLCNYVKQTPGSVNRYACWL